MGFFFDALLIDIIAVLATAISILYAFFKYRYTYWERHGIPSFAPTFPFGNQKDQVLVRKSPGEIHTKFYREAKQNGWRFVGLYALHRPYLLLIEPELVKDILSRDFEYFHDRRIAVDEKNDPLTGHLVSLPGLKWKNLRAKLTPTFTSGKMKMMFHTMTACTDGLESLLNEYASQKEPVDIKEVLCRFTTDIIGSCAFGIECNSLKDPDNLFRKYGKKIFSPSYKTILKTMLITAFPNVGKFFRMRRTPNDVHHFFLNLVEETVQYRELNKVQRADFMQLLIQMKNDDEKLASEDDIGKRLSMSEMAAQVFVFFLAGFETSSTTMTFVLFDLAVHQEIQDKLREEINRMFAKYDGKLTYDGMMELTYMDKVIQESQRLHAPISLLGRICTKDYKLRDSEFVIKTGTAVVISVKGLQNDPEHYPNPEKYDPERFSAEQKDNRHPYTFLPFGEGPRNCIGLRFGLLQTKVGLASVLRNHRVTFNSKTKLPLQYDPRNIITSVKGDVWLNLEKV